ncbi:MmgE/PrpD family protein [Sphingomonas psychrotolerans]|uniref:MmgE/PrpD family protein n=1 Tax=Sphingomonas psychrotolerans TaxID=1327635 RepID=A0ABU3N1L5_9SPHN|nr:MmgE/PrpD family protein [Sphingomonas psychrotolerans]MDT8758427.1 MmgE/PrpD family protein [Sphingomonas psychrotolerans]
MAHVAGLSFEALPGATVAGTRRSLLDTIGVMLGASGLAEEALPYRRHALAGGAGPSRLLGTHDGATPAMAALANGALAHALDYGDTFDAGPAHPSAAVVPALLALADADRAVDLASLIAAMTAGTDLACRLSIASPEPYETRGWYPPPLVGMIAAAAACARLLGLGAEGVRHAMGLAMLQGGFPGEIKYDGTSPLRAVREGFAARAAVEAALLARGGARAFAEPLEGKGGFFAIYGGGAPTERLTEGLGDRFLGDEVSLKPWPSCRGTHAYVEAALALRPQLAGRRIARIEAETGLIQEMLIRPQPAKATPDSAIQAKFSIPFTVAHALVHGELTLDSFDAAARSEPAVLALAAMVVERRNPAWGREFAASGALSVVFEDGTRLDRAVPVPRGSPERPLGDSEIVAKFVQCAGKAAVPLNPDRAGRLADRILHADPATSAASLLD